MDATYVPNEHVHMVINSSARDKPAMRKQKKGYE
jgi:hypothetical protein